MTYSGLRSSRCGGLSPFAKFRMGESRSRLAVLGLPSLWCDLNIAYIFNVGHLNIAGVLYAVPSTIFIPKNIIILFAF